MVQNKWEDQLELEFKPQRSCCSQGALTSQRGEMVLGIIANSVAAVVCLFTAVMNFFTDMFLTAPLKATLKHLEDTQLKTLKGETRLVKAQCLWERSGAVILAVRRPG